MIRAAIILALGIWGATDAGMTREEAAAFAAQASLDMDAEAILANPSKRHAVMSAMLCNAQERERDASAALKHDLSRPLVRAHQRAMADACAVSQALAVLDLEAISCSHVDVSPLVECLSVLAPPRCDRLPEVRAAEILMLSMRPKTMEVK